MQSFTQLCRWVERRLNRPPFSPHRLVVVVVVFLLPPPPPFAFFSFHLTCLTLFPVLFPLIPSPFPLTSPLHPRFPFVQFLSCSLPAPIPPPPSLLISPLLRKPTSLPKINPEKPDDGSSITDVDFSTDKEALQAITRYALQVQKHVKKPISPTAVYTSMPCPLPTYPSVFSVQR